jgi:hypothetical protein
MKRERGPNTKQLMYSQSVLYAAVEVLREKAGFDADTFEKMVDDKYLEMFPEANKVEDNKTEVVI